MKRNCDYCSSETGELVLVSGGSGEGRQRPSRPLSRIFLNFMQFSKKLCQIRMRSSRIRTPCSLPYGGSPWQRPPPCTESQTAVKTLPCRNFIAGGNNKLPPPPGNPESATTTSITDSPPVGPINTISDVFRLCEFLNSPPPQIMSRKQLTRTQTFHRLHMETRYFALRNLFLKFAVNFFNQNVKAMPGNKQMP